jgi:hypothetical protein
MIGEALIAHELAHVVQQQSGRASAHSSAPAENGTLEEDADRSAISAVVSIFGGLKGALKQVGSSAMPRLRSGLHLARCKDKNPCTTRTAQPAPVKTVTVRHTHLAGGKDSGTFSNHLAYANKVWAIAGISFTAGNEETIGPDATRALLGSPSFLNNSQPVEPRAYTAEETALLAHNNAPGEATAYFIEDFENVKANAITYPEKSGIVIAKRAEQRTLAHEIGHLLIGAGGHNSVNDNIMAWSGVATGVDCLGDEQIDTARKSSLPK